VSVPVIAIPEFAAGAMENWGLVTYREVDLLVDLPTASSRQLQRVAETVIHELAHQWFGNLVTMEWWDDLWLNEGFATWMETGITGSLHPEWSMWEQFITDMQGAALSLDAKRSSHPVQVPIRDAAEVEQVFDAISYCKGGAIVRMAHAVVGEQAFFGGLREYMAQFKYGNATTGDLWAAWAKACGPGQGVPDFPQVRTVRRDGSTVCGGLCSEHQNVCIGYTQACTQVHRSPRLCLVPRARHAAG
jgi:puromycin-sensitive aminopeptidase